MTTARPTARAIQVPIRLGLNTTQVQNGLRRLFQLTASLNTAITQTATRTALGQLGSLAERLRGALFTNTGLPPIIRTTGEFEKYGAVLETVTGSAEKARESLAWVADFATRTPYDLSGVTQAFVKLRAYGIDPTDGTLAALGDTAAALGKDMIAAVEALADAVTGENERLKEFGVTAKVIGQNITYSWVQNGKQMQAVVDRNNREAIRSTLISIFNGQYSGAMEKLSKTWGGIVSNLQDTWQRFLLVIGRSGVFEYTKEIVQELLDTINSWFKDGSLDAMARQISDFYVRGLRVARTLGRAFVKATQDLFRVISGRNLLVRGGRGIFIDSNKNEVRDSTEQFLAGYRLNLNFPRLSRTYTRIRNFFYDVKETFDDFQRYLTGQPVQNSWVQTTLDGLGRTIELFRLFFTDFIGWILGNRISPENSWIFAFFDALLEAALRVGAVYARLGVGIVRGIRGLSGENQAGLASGFDRLLVGVEKLGGAAVRVTDDLFNLLNNGLQAQNLNYEWVRDVAAIFDQARQVIGDFFTYLTSPEVLGEDGRPIFSEDRFFKPGFVAGLDAAFKTITAAALGLLDVVQQILTGNITSPWLVNLLNVFERIAHIIDKFGESRFAKMLGVDFSEIPEDPNAPRRRRDEDAIDFQIRQAEYDMQRRGTPAQPEPGLLDFAPLFRSLNVAAREARLDLLRTDAGRARALETNAAALGGMPPAAAAAAVEAPAAAEPSGRPIVFEFSDGTTVNAATTQDAARELERQLAKRRAAQIHVAPTTATGGVR